MILKVAARLVCFLAFGTSGLLAQEEVDGKWVDNNLELVLIQESIRTDGRLTYCIGQIDQERCVENVFTGMEIRVFDSSGKEIWNGLWTGKEKSIRFRKALPEAHRLEFRATRSFVINWMTGTRIHQDEPMKMTYYLP